MFNFGEMGKLLSADFLSQVTTFMTEWTRFMQKLGDRLGFMEGMISSIDNRLAHLTREVDVANERLLWLMSETSITPGLHDQVLRMSGADPRQVEVIPNDA